jgi:hypothetical protein
MSVCLSVNMHAYIHDKHSSQQTKFHSVFQDASPCKQTHAQTISRRMAHPVRKSYIYTNIHMRAHTHCNRPGDRLRVLRTLTTHQTHTNRPDSRQSSRPDSRLSNRPDSRQSSRPDSRLSNRPDSRQSKAGVSRWEAGSIVRVSTRGVGKRSRRVYAVRVDADGVILEDVQETCMQRIAEKGPPVDTSLYR